MSLLLRLISSSWFWVDMALSITGGVIVYWGLAVEKKAEALLPPENFKPEADLYADIVKTQKSELERGWRILMTGIVFEVVAAFGISIISGLEIAETTERTEKLEAANLLLRSNVVALEIKAKPRRITPENKEKFIHFLSDYPKGPVRIFVGRQDDELLDFSRHVREVLDSAGYGTTNSPGIIPLGENSGYYTAIGEETTTRVSIFIMFSATNSQIIWPGIEFVPDGYGQTITNCRRDDPRAIPVFISAAMKEIGITTAYTTTQQLLPPGEWGLMIRQKF